MVYGFVTDGWFIISVTIGFTCFLILALLVLCIKYTLKPILMVLLLASSFAAYFMDTYNVLIDTDMIQNTLSTDVSETTDLLSLTLLIYVLLLGILPAALLFKLPVTFYGLSKEIITRIKIATVLLCVMTILFFISSAAFSSFFRENKQIRYYFNPANFIYATAKHISRSLKSNVIIVSQTGQDARIPAEDKDRELVVLVVGETARADRFSLNGYNKDTNPLLKKQKIVSFTNVRSCGTSTAISVPCMFSILGEDEFSVKKARQKENVLDVLAHANTQILWRDNNSSSKNVADRMEYEDYCTSKTNTLCDEECRDEGMLVGLDDYIKNHPQGDIMIVLHQMGNHGPAYYKRYPKEFEKIYSGLQNQRACRLLN